MVKGSHSSVTASMVIGHVLCQIIENVGQESQIRDRIMFGSGPGGHGWSLLWWSWVVIIMVVMGGQSSYPVNMGMMYVQL